MDPWYMAAFLAVAVVLGVALPLSALAMEEVSLRRYPRRVNVLRLFWLSFLENFAYRQLSAWWRLGAPSRPSGAWRAGA